MVLYMIYIRNLRITAENWVSKNQDDLINFAKSGRAEKDEAERILNVLAGRVQEIESKN